MALLHWTSSQLWCHHSVLQCPHLNNGLSLTTYECGHVTGSDKEDLAGHLPASSLPVFALIF